MSQIRLQGNDNKVVSFATNVLLLSNVFKRMIDGNYYYKAS